MLRTGLIFGIIEVITPVIGWGLGLAASQFIMKWDHWVAFTLLLVLGIRMIIEGICKELMAPMRNMYVFLPVSLR